MSTSMRQAVLLSPGKLAWREALVPLLQSACETWTDPSLFVAVSRV